MRNATGKAVNETDRERQDTLPSEGETPSERREGERRRNDRRRGDRRRERDEDVGQTANRVVARAADLLVFLALVEWLPSVGLLAGLLYLLIADGLSGGQSLGKRIARIHVVCDADGQPAGFLESALRNAPFAVVGLFLGIPLLGWILLASVGLLIVGIELYFVVSDPQGKRLGDIIAATRVVRGSSRRSSPAGGPETPKD